MNDDAVDAQHPWLGLASFTEETRGWFYGRDDEVTELARRVQRKPLTVLFGQSGLGKTSILRAGIAPRLRLEGYCPVVVRIDHAPDAPAPSEQIKQAILRTTQSVGRWTQPGAAVEGETLWEFLHHRDDVLLDDSGKALTPLLIFDQFEEIFTLAQGDDAGRQRAARFIEDLADLVENRLPRALEAKLDSDESVIERFDLTRGDYRILIALREDYLAHLEGLKGQTPSITQNRMRLARMTGAQALDAVRKPGGALVNEEVAESIVRFVAGGAELRNAEVEPSLLSLICRELNNARIAQRRGEISVDLLAGSRDTILAEFYERALADQPPGVRSFIEDQMLTDSGFRESLAEERVLKAFAAAGAAPDALAVLVNRRLLRIEERLDLRRAELTHDVLCAVVAASRELRHEREARDAAERQLAEQRTREAASRRSLMRARKIAIGCALLAGFAVVAAGFGIWGMHRAQTTRAMAEVARSESERLIVYLLDDFQRELEPFGRLNTVGELAKRVIDYYAALPAEQRTPETARNEALAQVRWGTVLRIQGNTDEARKVLETAVVALNAMRARGDSSEAAAIGLSAGLLAQSRLVEDVGNYDEAREHADRAVAVLPRATESNRASVSLLRARGAALGHLGSHHLNQLNQQSTEAAATSLQGALEAYRSIDNLQTDSHAIGNFGVATARLVIAFGNLDRPTDVDRSSAEGLDLATRLLEREPTNMLGLGARGLLWDALSIVADDQLHPSRRLVASENSAEDWATLSRVDPANVVSRRNLIVTRMNAAAALWDLGRLRAGLAKAQELRQFESFASTSTLVAEWLGFALYSAAIFAAELGQVAMADHLIADSNRHLGTLVRELPPNSFELVFRREDQRVVAVELANLLNDRARARAAADGLRQSLLQLQPADDFGRERVAWNLRRLHVALGWAELQVKDYAAAQEHFSHVAEARKLLPARTLRQKLEAADESALLAITLARTGRVDESRERAEAALTWQRAHQERMAEYPWRHWSLALALVAAAESTPAKSRALLIEAQAELDRLPPELRAARSNRMLQGLIADARRAKR